MNKGGVSEIMMRSSDEQKKGKFFAKNFFLRSFNEQKKRKIFYQKFLRAKKKRRKKFLRALTRFQLFQLQIGSVSPLPSSNFGNFGSATELPQPQPSRSHFVELNILTRKKLRNGLSMMEN